MAVLGFDHVQVAIPEDGEDAARAFYGEVLGLNEVPKPSHLSSKGCWFVAGALNLHLGVDSDFRPARKAHPAMLVDDLARIEQTLIDAGHPIRQDKAVQGYARFFTEDPFGNRIEIMQRTV